MILLLTEMDKHVVINVYKFAVSRRQNFVPTTFIDKHQPTPDKSKRYSDSNNNLERYLESLSFEQIKIVKTLMYLGREVSDQDRFENSGRELYRIQYKDLEWEFKRNGMGIQILSIIEKKNLDELLFRGLKIIGIEV